MTFDYFMPADCTGTTLDDYLKEAWFRDGPMMSRYEMIYFREHVYSIVPIRVVLENFQFTKSQRKLIRKNNEYKIKIQPLEITPEKEKMYAEHKGRFQSPNSPTTLKNYFLEEGNEESPFETWELQILDGDHLAAISFIDIGEEAICSILALFDPSYSKQSLGITSMLYEIEYAQMSNKKYYYPGYVLDEDSVFDYKKRLNNLQFFSWTNFNWHSWKLFDKEETSNLMIRDKLNGLLQYFDESKKLELDIVQNEAFFYNVWHNTFDVSGIVPSPLYLEWESTWFHILTIDYAINEEEEEFYYSLRHSQVILYETKDPEEIAEAMQKWQMKIRNSAIIQQQHLFSLEEKLLAEGIHTDPSKMFSNGNKLDGFIEMAIEGKHLTMYISYYCNQKIFTLQASNDLRDITIDSFATAKDCANTICEWINRKTLSIVL
ncbi:hypothetical protein [Flammeovirga pacifica]|uniref:N-end rule aminoacyl transferase C-terminal domain-containing protein n=1 Tax=Flammeovirga pacifica TaxID=915059 RepID=A0A1S1YYZ5_FLAPC|nr:hypothetical protein [Flammeovirga pacifica]OHX66220.1 hypothetical protein NH26_07580 [Flammeovirga pacifica]